MRDKPFLPFVSTIWRAEVKITVTYGRIERLELYGKVLLVSRVSLSFKIDTRTLPEI